METAIASLIEIMGISAFVFYLFRALQTKIGSLEDVIKIQNDTLAVMERRIEETEKVGSIYKNLMAELPTDLDNYKTIISKTKDEMILELRNQNDIKEGKLKAAEENLKKAGGSAEIIRQHLIILKNMAISNNGNSNRKQYDLTTISEFNDRSLEDAPALILASKTVDEYLEKLGFKVFITEDQSVMDGLFLNREEGQKRDFKIARTTMGLHGWYVLKDDELHITPGQLSSLKDDFSIIKSNNVIQELAK